MFHSVLFDLDGTLLNTLQDLTHACNQTLSALGLGRHTAEDYKKMVGNGVPKLIWRMLPEQSRGEHTLALASELFGRYYTQQMQQFTHPYVGIVDMLAQLKQAGVSLGVVSNKQAVFARPIVENYFPGIFSVVAGPNEETPPKPAPNMLHFALEQLCADASSTLFVGDSDVDMLAAKNAALKSCGVLWGFRSQEELCTAGADFLAQTPQEVAELVLR